MGVCAGIGGRGGGEVALETNFGFMGGLGFVGGRGVGFIVVAVVFGGGRGGAGDGEVQV